MVADTAIPASLALIQYDLLGGAALDTDGVRVPTPRFRLNVTVPVMTLLGGSQEPGMLEGTIPIPASMARELAGQGDTWYRVLTDRATASSYRYPRSATMPPAPCSSICACATPPARSPGCTRPTSWASEADHIEEYDHGDPERGGLAE